MSFFVLKEHLPMKKIVFHKNFQEGNKTYVSLVSTVHKTPNGHKDILSVNLDFIAPDINLHTEKLSRHYGAFLGVAAVKDV